MTKREVEAIFEFGVWTLVWDFTVCFSNLKVQLLKAELDINPDKGNVKIAGTGLSGPWMQYKRKVRIRRSTRDWKRCLKWPSMLKRIDCILQFYSKYTKSVAHLFPLSCRANPVITNNRGFIITVFKCPDISLVKGGGLAQSDAGQMFYDKMHPQY